MERIGIAAALCAFGKALFAGLGASKKACAGRRSLEMRGCLGYDLRGAILRVPDKEVMPVEHILREIIVAVVAGIIVALINRKMK